MDLKGKKDNSKFYIQYCPYKLCISKQRYWSYGWPDQEVLTLDTGKMSNLKNFGWPVQMSNQEKFDISGVD